MILFGTKPLDTANEQIQLALLLGFTLIAASVIHKIKFGWRWPGLKLIKIPGTIFNIAFFYAFFAFTAYSMSPNIPAPNITLDNVITIVKDSWPVIMQVASTPNITPWYLAGCGIVIFSIMASLNLVCHSKSEFDSNCHRNSKNRDSYKINKDI